jgi:flagellar biosynthesis/type III secretory pathway M-ring protein FliF/YscJ
MNISWEAVGVLVTIVVAVITLAGWMIGRSEKRAEGRRLTEEKRAEERRLAAEKLVSIEAQLNHLTEDLREHKKDAGSDLDQVRRDVELIRRDVAALVKELLMSKL